MKKRSSFFYHITLFVIAQLFWLMLLGLWIYWYVSNYIIFKQAGDKLSPQIIYDGTNVVALVGGLILLVAISFSMSLIFRHLNVQVKLTNLYANFIANITHELKSPLSSIQLYLETLKSRDVPKDRQDEFIALMMKDANRLKNLINSILDISAFEQKKIVFNYQVYDAEDLIKKTVKESVEQKNLAENIINIKGKLNCQIVIAKNEFKMLIDNLIDNAIKYTTNNLKINITLKQFPSKLILDFKDNGIGVSLSEQKKIFSKFYRVYDVNIPNVKGTGLGLFWVREIIKNHGGKISAYSEGFEKGTTFRIELPIYKKSKIRLHNKLLKSNKNKDKNR